MTGMDARAQTAKSNFVFRNRQSKEYFSVATGDFNAYLCVISRSQIYIDYRREQKKLLWTAFVMEEVDIPPLASSWDIVVLSTAEARGVEVTALGTTRT